MGSVPDPKEKKVTNSDIYKSAENGGPEIGGPENAGTNNYGEYSTYNHSQMLKAAFAGYYQYLAFTA